MIVQLQRVDIVDNGSTIRVPEQTQVDAFFGTLAHNGTHIRQRSLTPPGTMLDEEL